MRDLRKGHQKNKGESTAVKDEQFAQSLEFFAELELVETAGVAHQHLVLGLLEEIRLWLELV